MLRIKGSGLTFVMTVMAEEKKGRIRRKERANLYTFISWWVSLS